MILPSLEHALSKDSVENTWNEFVDSFFADANISDTGMPLDNFEYLSLGENQEKWCSHMNQVGDERAPLILTMSHHSLRAFKIAHSYYNNNANHVLLEREDLKNAGVEGLFEAATKWNYMTIPSFTAFSSLYIKSRIVDEIRRGVWASVIPKYIRRTLPKFIEKKNGAVHNYQQKKGREPTIEECAKFIGWDKKEYEKFEDALRVTYILSMNEPLYNGGPNEQTLEEQLTGADALREIMSFSNGLIHDHVRRIIYGVTKNPRDADITTLYIFGNTGLKGRLSEETPTLKIISEIYDLTEGRISQIVGKTLSKTKEYISPQDFVLD